MRKDIVKTKFSHKKQNFISNRSINDIQQKKNKNVCKKILQQQCKKIILKQFRRKLGQNLCNYFLEFTRAAYNKAIEMLEKKMLRHYS